MKTAVVDMNISPGRVLANRMLRPSRAFWPVRVTRLQNRVKIWLIAGSGPAGHSDQSGPPDCKTGLNKG